MRVCDRDGAFSCRTRPRRFQPGRSGGVTVRDGHGAGNRVTAHGRFFPDGAGRVTIGPAAADFSAALVLPAPAAGTGLQR